ncbi:hypothetical protein XELAEV_18006969mg, partial [Xenopus laevis]
SKLSSGLASSSRGRRGISWEEEAALSSQTTAAPYMALVAELGCSIRRQGRYRLRRNLAATRHYCWANRSGTIKTSVIL